MSRVTESALADPQQVIANLQQQLDERTAQRDALRREDCREWCTVVCSSRWVCAARSAAIRRGPDR
jgi:hypothetical protein